MKMSEETALLREHDIRFIRYSDTYPKRHNRRRIAIEIKQPDLSKAKEILLKLGFKQSTIYAYRFYKYVTVRNPRVLRSTQK